ncbi:hypothetical protein [Halomonas sp. N3-2A]|uniref:hypothetical protein n=1 Tax=Halomonas sp. N3-2A TaxID=2014541 RepID=UPI000B5B2B6E|nr:hypothetical protein [Halomonas sp. N3-2A]ASK18476.1 hypothetical protein CEK60_03750 [Halomonas sp. N3-2A]
MNYHNLDEFIEEITALEEFFTEFAAREDEVLTRGMRRVADWESYQRSAEILKTFETRIHEYHAFLRPIDKSLYERVVTLTTDSKLVESIVGIEVSLRIATQRQKLNFSGELANTLLFQLPYISNAIRRRKLFSEEVIPIQKLLVAIGRLKNLVGISKDVYIHQWSHDSDVFKPSNLDDEKIITYIEEAISCIENQSSLPKEDRKQLVEYLNKAKSEFSEDRPSWNKIVGALVIAAAITSGIADSSGAMENIDAAIKYILGTSVEKHIPTPVPLLEQPKKDRGDTNEPEVISV